MKLRRFSHSFRPVFGDLKPDEQCCLQHHFRGAIREVVGILDLWAANDPERFVQLTGGVDAIVRYCHYYKQKDKHFSKSIIEFALKELRARYIISKKVWRMRNGALVDGFIVTPHDCLAVREADDRCVWKGQLRAPGRWARDEVKDESGQPTGKLGPVYWAGYAGVGCAVGPSVGPKKRSVGSSVGPSVGSPIPAKDLETQAVISEIAPNRVNRWSRSQSAVEIVQTNILTTTSRLNSSQGEFVDEINSNTNRKTSGGVVLENQRLNDYSKTIGDHFGTAPVWVNIETMAAGQMNLAVWKKVDEVTQRNLLECCNEVIADMAAEPYRGVATNGMLMDLALQRFSKKFGQYPSCWQRVLNDLKRAGNTALETTR